MVLNLWFVLCFLLGMLSSALCVVLGVKIATRTVEHSVTTYVKKLTPEESKQIYGKEEIPEENLRALDMDEQEYKKMMGWSRDGEEADY